MKWTIRKIRHEMVRPGWIAYLQNSEGNNIHYRYFTNWEEVLDALNGHNRSTLDSTERDKER